MFFEGKVTDDWEFIMRWATVRNGKPALMKKTNGPDFVESLQIAFNDCEEQTNLTQISWDEFFEKFEKDRLVFMYQDAERNGNLSRDYRFL